MMEIGERTVRMFFNAEAPGIGEVDESRLETHEYKRDDTRPEVEGMVVKEIY
jgi:hypothetical protein